MSQHGQRRIQGVVHANQAQHAERRYYDPRGPPKPRIVSGHSGRDRGLPPRDPREARLVA